MPDIPKQRRPGQTGNWAGHGKNAQAFNKRQKASKPGCLMVAAIAFTLIATLPPLTLMIRSLT
jgi:hypothetical protein